MAGFGLGTPSLSTNSSTSKLPPPLASSTPKKRLNGFVNGSSSSSKTPNQTKPNGVNGDASPYKKRKIVYMEENEDHGERLIVNGHTTTTSEKVNGKAGHAKASKKFHDLQDQRRQLPITKGKEALIREFRENDTVVLVGETGSGKTTQVPQYILEAGLCGDGQVAVTQPRRVAATSLAARVAEEQGVVLGTRVGYAVRFNERHEPSTKIKYLTDGMLSRELLADPMLSRYSVIIIDEAHERTLNTDILLANLKNIQKERKKRYATPETSLATVKGKEKARDEGYRLRIVVMSATLDADKFSRFFNDAKVLYVKGRQHPVRIFYTLNSQPDYADAAVRTFFQIHVDHEPGDVLIFLPGQEDIETVQQMIKSYANQLPLGQMSVLTCPMYAQLPQNMQTQVFRHTPEGTRKCILATNIAETSITIPGVQYVIDSGKHNEKRHYEYAGGGLDSLMTQDISKSSAMQRAGRAGREGPGLCFRLYTESNFRKMEDTYLPEILRTNLVSSVLQLKCLGQDIQSLEFMDQPDNDTVKAAYATLLILGALDKRKEVTRIGRMMNKFPLDPPLARALLAAQEFGCTYEIIGIVSVLSASAKLFFDSVEQRESAAESRARFRHASGDHLTALNTFRAYEELVKGGAVKSARRQWCQEHFVNERTLSEAVDIQNQLRNICEREKVDWRTSAGAATESVLNALLFGLAQNTAVYRSEIKAYKQILSNSVLRIHPGSVLSDRRPVAIMYDQPLYTKEIYARGVSIVEPAMLSRHPSFQPSKAEYKN
ncbi:P-loop containing nucleoside triphosphate hydrolase protein [Fomitiporia mediterranea MF3/22]|uniref:P-loop containing nucleoside triphosphate hydrolase protein n=1 Tax=Fomitiporia mediterranea (strain MF3/22) TaxID=694068 RepID=UPI0004407B07|nr:P-loop containing nucleoside triphosphate hydrolase protein [Fomitiporia mediterranea MF3/22]EJC98012.1 P-loop containing nucleoside triphosphate hydrolase protein [Fomitiporia mediterranea MF3/22]